MGLFKLCGHRGRNRDLCEHLWWASFRGVRTSLSRWTDRDIHNKADAGAALDEFRRAVRAGTFDPRGLTPLPEAGTLTFRKFADIYKKRHVQAKKLASAATIDYRLKPLIDHFGDRQLSAIKTADIEDFIADLKLPRVVNRRSNCELAPASINRTIELLRHMLNWAVGREHLERTPFRRGTESLIRKQHEDNRRRRRLSEDEETDLLTVAPPFLRSMIITALDTGMRRGEMLAMRFGDIDWKRQLIVLRGQTTKSRKSRVIPISTARLRSILDWLRLDADGEKKPDDALVFSDEIGDPIGRFRTAWVTAVLKAHGVKPEWNAYGWTALSPACHAQFRKINLHWHDLRHEYASRLVERGVPLAQVRDLLGHASITTTERYDNQKLENLQAAALKLESGKSFDPIDTRVAEKRDANADKVSRFFQDPRRKSSRDDGKIDDQTQSNLEGKKALDDWLGGRDSNPDNVVQSHVSYRWTTSQCQSRRLSEQELSIIAVALTLGKPRAHRRSRRTVRGHSSPAVRCRPNHSPAAAPACADDWPSRPCGPPRAPRHSSTRAPNLSDAPPCHPYSRSRAACCDPSTQIRDLLWPPGPPKGLGAPLGDPLRSRAPHCDRSKLQPMCHTRTQLSCKN